MKRRRGLGLALGMLLLAGCVWGPEGEIVPPAPEKPCAGAVGEWEGIVPGKSTRQEVVDRLGNPDHQGVLEYPEGRFRYYGYRIAGGRVAEYAEDQIFFDRNGVVAWMLIPVADRDGTLHSLREAVDQFGTSPDSIYINNNDQPDPGPGIQMDILAGPDEISVWSECGIAVTLSIKCFSSEEIDTECIDFENAQELDIALPITPTQNHLSSLALMASVPDMQSEVLAKLIFPPTSYEGFYTFYEYKIPFRFLKPYLDDVSD